MAKKIKIVYDRTNDYLKKYQSGLDTIVDFNGKFYQVQYEFANYLISILAKNERAQQYLDPLIVHGSAVSSTAGFINRPTDFMYFLSGSYEGTPIHKLSVNQFETYEQIPQRRGNLAKKRINIMSVDGKWKVSPSTVIAIDVIYVKHPAESTIVFTETATADEDVLVYDDATTVDFEWSADCINILVFMMLEKIGISVREQLLNEYAQLGLAKEAVK